MKIFCESMLMYIREESMIRSVLIDYEESLCSLAGSSQDQPSILLLLYYWILHSKAAVKRCSEK